MTFKSSLKEWAIVTLVIVSMQWPAFAFPTDLAKRVQDGSLASTSDVAAVGYATLGGGTTGGRGGPTVTVSSYSALVSAVSGNQPRIAIVSGTINQAGKTRVGSNKSIIGRESSAHLIGNGFFVWKQNNVIIRNLRISKVRAANGDAVGIQASSRVWVDHCDLSSDQAHGKNYYDGLLDVTHASDYVTISNTHFHDHFKGSLVGHSDKNGQEDTGHLRITFHNNLWTNVHSRAPSLRFGTGHVFNSYFSNVTDGINCRDNAQLLVQNNVFVNATKPLYSTKGGYAIAKDNDFGSAQNTALQGKLNSVPYKYRLESTASLNSMTRSVGNTLSFRGH